MKRKLYSIFVLAVLLSSGALALPVAKGTYPIPSSRFNTLKSIIDTLNAFGIAGGTAPEVTINLTAGFPGESMGPYILGSCVLNASGVPIVINGSGKTITAHSGTGSTDAIFMVQGTDNVTIKNFIFAESAANTTATTMMEWGVAGVKYNDCGSIDGIQTLNITDCEITLNKTNATAAGGTSPAGSAGVFIGNNTAISRTALAGPPSADGSNRFFYIARNKITNVNHGIWCAGLRTDATGAVSGDAFLTLEENNISNFTHNGIAISHFNNDQVQTNTINNMNDGGTAPTANTLFGIRYINDPSLQTNASWNCIKNNIDLTINTSGTTFSAVGIMSQIFGNGATDISSDTVKLTSSGTSALLAGIFSQNEIGTQTISKNYIKDFTTQTTNAQAAVGIHAGGYSRWTGIGLGNTYSSTYYSVFPATNTVSENIVENFSVASGAADICAAIQWDNLSTGSMTISKNKIDKFATNNSSASMRVLGTNWVRNMGSTPTIHATTISENTITNVSTTGAANTTPVLVVIPLGTYPNGHTFTSTKNKISNVSANNIVFVYNSDFCISYSMDKDTISNINSAASHAIGLINAGSNVSSTSVANYYSSKTVTVKNCSFTGLNSTSLASGTLAVGIQLQPGNIVGNQLGEANISNNIINDINTSDLGGIALGINVQTSPANINMNNNMISDISAPSSTGTYSSSYGALLQNTGSNNIFYNTITLGTGTGYGASGIAYNPAGSNTIQNNIIRADVTAGTGNNVVAMRALAGSASAAPSSGAFTAASNIYYTPKGPNNYLYAEGTTNASLVNGFHLSGLTPSTTKNIVNDKYFNSDCDKSLYHQFMQTGTPSRELNTYTEDNLTSLGGGSYAPLAGSISFAEGKATDISIATDIKLDPRFVGASDIGAWEFDGKQIPVMDISIASSTGYDTACPYNLPSLTATIPDYFKGKVLFQWYRGNTALTGATGPTVMVSPVSGTYYITVFDTSTGCTDTSEEFRMTIVPPPPAIITYYDSLTFCETSAIVIQANKGYKYTYRWFFNSGEIPGETNDHLVVDKTGEYSLEVNTPLGCATSSAPIRVKVYPLPKPTVFSDGPQRLKTQKYFTYQWYRNNVKIDDTDATGQTIYIQSKWGDGAYSVEVTDSNGCTAKSDVYLYSILSLDNAATATIKVYPNPATDHLYIESSMPGIQAQLTDLAGRVIIGNTGSKELDMSTLAEGMYLLTLSDQDGKQIKVQKINKVK